MANAALDKLDRRIINRLQDGLPISATPFAEVASELNLSESELIQRVQGLLDDGYLSRFGPLYNAERLGGALSLVAMAVPAEELEPIAEQINSFPQVAHNYARDHHFNIWFVLATETAAEITSVLAEIEQCCGYPVYSMPKIQEFFIGLRLHI